MMVRWRCFPQSETPVKQIASNPLNNESGFSFFYSRYFHIGIPMKVLKKNTNVQS